MLILRNGLIAGYLLTLLAAPSASRADEATQLQHLIERVAPSIVIVKCVLKTTGVQGGDREAKADINGVVVDKTGLVMIPNTLFSYARVSTLMGNSMGRAPDFKMYPTNITTMFDDDEKEYPTTLVATDTKLDLAFLKVDGLGTKKLTPVDFNAGSAGTIGQEVFTVTRMHKGFDYAPYFESSRICGAVSKPKKAYIVEGGLDGLGLPVFNSAGEALGVLTTIESGIKEEALMEGMTFQIYTHQFIGSKSGMVQTFVLPCQTVYGVVSQAKLKAAEGLSKKEPAKK